MATIKKAQNGTTTKKPASRKMSEAQLSALAHQKRGMGPVDNTYVKKPGAIMNELGTLNEDQVKQLKNYMNKSSTAEKIYQALPNVGRIFGKSAADVPSKKTGGAVKKKMKNGGSLSALKASTKRDKGIDPKGAYTTVQKKTLAGAKGKAKLTADKQLGATKMQNGGSVGSKVVKENPRQQKRLSRIKENNPERAERVEKRMVKRADRAMGARGAASRMKSGGSVKKK